MIINVLEVITEFIGIILCLHKVARKKIHIDKYICILFLVEFAGIILANKYKNIDKFFYLIVYISLLLYVKGRLECDWKNTVKIFGVMLLTIPSLQLLVYYVLKFVFIKYYARQDFVIFTNISVCLLILLWKSKLTYRIAKCIQRNIGVLIICFFIIYSSFILDRYRKIQYLYSTITLPIVIGTLCIMAVLVLFIKSEADKKRKIKEVEIYDMYNKKFEEAITTIRSRQHEFDNHINAIKCMQFTIDDKEELFKAQNEYCNQILKDNAINKILKSNVEPILISFLYSKFLYAQMQEILITYEIDAIETREYIVINDLIEILGILIDNAIEALKESMSKQMIVKIRCQNNNSILIEVANTHRKCNHHELEHFFDYGYSTKGENRGIGLYRVKELCKKNNVKLRIENVTYSGENFLKFEMVKNKNKDGTD